MTRSLAKHPVIRRDEGRSEKRNERQYRRRLDRRYSHAKWRETMTMITTTMAATANIPAVKDEDTRSTAYMYIATMRSCARAPRQLGFRWVSRTQPRVKNPGKASGALNIISTLDVASLISRERCDTCGSVFLNMRYTELHICCPSFPTCFRLLYDTLSRGETTFFYWILGCRVLGLGTLLSFVHF